MLNVAASGGVGSVRSVRSAVPVDERIVSPMREAAPVRVLSSDSFCRNRVGTVGVVVETVVETIAML